MKRTRAPSLGSYEEDPISTEGLHRTDGATHYEEFRAGLARLRHGLVSTNDSTGTGNAAGIPQAPEAAALHGASTASALNASSTAITKPDTRRTPEAIERACLEAARALSEAQALLVFAGAGCSADCGLPCYKDIVKGNSTAGKTYQELCDPGWLSVDPNVFYEFWGSCHEAYHAVRPHSGYERLLEWTNIVRANAKAANITASGGLQAEVPLHPQARVRRDTKSAWDPTFVLTSNVDEMFARAGFDADSLYEFHGNINRWQCEVKDCGRSWRLPADFRFRAEKKRQTATAESAAERRPRRRRSCASNTATSAGAEWRSIKCRSANCDFFARPNIQMFNDRDFVENKRQVNLYCRWRRALYARAAGCTSRKVSRCTEPSDEGGSAIAKKRSAVESGDRAGGPTAAAAAGVPSTFRAVLLEVGCGTSVPRLRWEAEKMARDLGAHATLIRINLDEPDGCIVQEWSGGRSAGALISVRMHARNAIERIHELLVSKFARQVRSPIEGKEQEQADETGVEA